MVKDSFIDNGQVVEVATDLLCVEFLTEEYCEYLITVFENLGNWPDP